MKSELWLLVTADEYELPLIIADTIRELSRKSGISVNAIRSGANRYRNGKIHHSQYHRISLEEGDTP